MSVLSAARTLGGLSGWTLSNLEIQKTLYMAQIVHLGRYSAALFADDFEAWDYGPVVPHLYRSLKAYGRGPVPNIFADPVFQEGSTHATAVAEAWNVARFMTAGQLISYTHVPGGAWDTFYDPAFRNTVIPLEYIAREASPDARASEEAVEWALSMAADIEKSPAKYLAPEDERAFRARLCAGSGGQPASSH